MDDEPIRLNAEARWRHGARAGWLAALFLLAVLAGALLWTVIIAPLISPVVRNLGAEAASGRVLRAAVAQSPALFLALAAWQAASILRRFMTGRARLQSSALSLAAAGAAVFMAGAMDVFGAPTVLAMLDGRFVARFAFTPEGIALIALGPILFLAARTMRES